MIAVMRPFGEVVASPYEITHTERELGELTRFLKSLSGETKVIMEYTGKYYQPVARYLREAGIFVCVVNAILVHDYGGSSLRRVKTDKKDAIKIANYGIDRWLDLTEYAPGKDIRQLLKTLNRQYNQYIKVKVMFKNDLIALLDQTFSDANRLFNSSARKDGHEKGVDFAATFWHCKCVSDVSENAFKECYAKWCKKHRHNYSPYEANEIYDKSCNPVSTLPKNDTAKLLVTQAIAQLNTIAETLAAVMTEMHRLTTLLPEYDIVMGVHGVGPTLGPQLAFLLWSMHNHCCIGFICCALFYW